MRFAGACQRQHRFHVHTKFSLVDERGATLENFAVMHHGLGQVEKTGISISSKLTRRLRARFDFNLRC